jgi:drug/metabolite transporter (DMT)-like permease
VRRLSTVDLMLLSTIVIWAFNITVTRYVLTHGFRPLAYASIRYTGAVLLTVAIALALEGTLAVGGRVNVGLLALAAVMLFLNQLAFVYSLRLTTGTTVALILGTTPTFAGLASIAVGVERPAPEFWAGALVTFAGVTLVALGSRGGLSSHLGGELLAVGLAASWAVYSVAIAPLMRRYSPYRVSALVLLAMCLPLLAVASPQLGEQDYGLDWLVWLALAFAIVGPLTLTNVLWFASIERIGPSRATLVTNLQPFLAAIFAYLILSERISGLQVAGGVLILAGILLERVRHAAAVTEEPERP